MLNRPPNFFKFYMLFYDIYYTENVFWLSPDEIKIEIINYSINKTLDSISFKTKF